MSSPEEMLEMMGISLEDALRADKKHRIGGRKSDKTICVCGHPSSRHKDEAGRKYCEPSKFMCYCEEARPVLETDDTRYFLRKTQGYGESHALTRGIAGTAEAGKGARWLDGKYKCWQCGVTEGRIVPASLNVLDGRVSKEGTKENLLLCVDCLESHL